MCYLLRQGHTVNLFSHYSLFKQRLNKQSTRQSKQHEQIIFLHQFLKSMLGDQQILKLSINLFTFLSEFRNTV